MDQKNDEELFDKNVSKGKPNSGIKFSVTNLYKRKSSSCNEDEIQNEKHLSQGSKVGLASD